MAHLDLEIVTIQTKPRWTEHRHGDLKHCLTDRHEGGAALLGARSVEDPNIAIVTEMLGHQ